MGTCIICGRDVDGRICRSHQEDVVFEYRGDDPNELVQNRFYRGVVDGYADFGVFVNLSSKVTGLLHRSELDRRLESLDWEPGDEVFVQVKNVRQNGNVDLTWSIRQADREFRGVLIQEGNEEYEVDEAGNRTAAETAERTDAVEDAPAAEATDSSAEDADDEASTADAAAVETEAVAEESTGFEPAEPEPATEPEPQNQPESAGERESTGEPESTSGPRSTSGPESTSESEPTSEPEPTSEAEAAPEATRRDIGSLSERVGELVRVEGEVVGVRQTGGPTVFELRDETGVVDCAAFVEAGVRAYPDVEIGDVVRLDGEVELRRNEIQVETEALVVLQGEEAADVTQRLADAMTAKARPESLDPLVEHDAVAAVEEQVLDAAEAVRRAVLESRPIVLRHGATADGYVAGAAIERAVLPLVREEHAKSDAVYHYFTRRPLDDAVYGMDAATNDVTRMLQDRDRHDEKLPLVVLVGTGSTVESDDGLGMLGLYGAERVVVDAATADPEIGETADVLVNPAAADADGADLTTGALAADLGAAINADAREDLRHLPAVSYWSDAPGAYIDLATEAGYDREAVTELREAVALEAYYQSYEDKRELITDLLFGESEARATAVAGAPADADESESLASHVAAQFREKLDVEVSTAEANLETTEADGVAVAVLDADAFTHRYDFPPTPLLLDELHRRQASGGDHVTVGVAMDELWLRASADLDVREVAANAAEQEPDAGITANGVREGRIEFLSGARDRVREAVIDAAVAQFD